LKHFSSPWKEDGKDLPDKGWANYLSDKLAELNPDQARYLRGRTPISVAVKRGASMSDEEWLMCPFFEKGWWTGFSAEWSVGDSVLPRKVVAARRRPKSNLSRHARQLGPARHRPVKLGAETSGFVLAVGDQSPKLPL
jgi:hypothetical protein